MKITRGDTGAYKFQRLDKSGNAITTTPTALYFTVKKTYSQSTFAFQKSLSDMTIDENGFWHFKIQPEDTDTLEYGTYVYDIEVTDGDYVQTIAKGDLDICEEATWYANK